MLSSLRAVLTPLDWPTEIATGRSQFNFPLSAPLPPPGQGRPMGSRHGAHASISGPISSPGNTNSFGGGQYNGQRGPPPAGGRMPIPPMQPHPQQHQQQLPQPRSNMPPIPPYGGASQTPPIPEHSRSPPQQQAPPQQPGMSSPPPAPVARGSRRQYAANTAAYIAGDTSGVGAPLTNHAHTQSQQFFSPATHDPSSQMFTPGAPQDFGGAAAAQGFQQPGAAIPPYAGGQQQQQQQPGVQGMSQQFGQMGLGGQKQMQVVSTTNLIGQPLNPAEMMAMSPPEIRLPPNVSVYRAERETELTRRRSQASFSQSETRNSDPSYQRSTINACPNTNSLLTKSKLPLALIITPYRSLKPGDVRRSLPFVLRLG